MVVALEQHDVGARAASAAATRRPGSATSTCVSAWTVFRAGSVTVRGVRGDAGVNASASSRAAAVDIDAVPWWYASSSRPVAWDQTLT